jgi:putative ABC transport system permease protein
MVKRKNRLTTDAVREVKNTFSRFLSILVLSALAVAFLAGLRATAPDMKYTADNYYDRTHMMDGYVISTLGLTDEDLDALAKADGVEEVEGVRTVDATATDSIVSIRAMPERLNLLEVVKGRLPQEASECVTDGRLLTELGLELGDTLEITLEEGDEDALARTEFTVVGTVICPLYAGTDRGTTSLGDGSLDGIVFVPGENLTADYYSVAYFTGTGLAVLDSYGDEYEDRMETLVDSLEPLGDQRAQLRYDSVVGEAQDSLNDAQGELDDAKG